MTRRQPSEDFRHGLRDAHTHLREIVDEAPALQRAAEAGLLRSCAHEIPRDRHAKIRFSATVAWLL
jgi:uncharacterized membrane protein